VKIVITEFDCNIFRFFFGDKLKITITIRKKEFVAVSRRCLVIVKMESLEVLLLTKYLLRKRNCVFVCVFVFLKREKEK
jgi:hypothetical protein